MTRWTHSGVALFSSDSGEGGRAFFKEEDFGVGDNGVGCGGGGSGGGNGGGSGGDNGRGSVGGNGYGGVSD